MVGQTQNHWKTIVSDGKTIEKPLLPMDGQNKTIEKPSSLMEKPLKNHRYQWFARPKTIDTNGCFPSEHVNLEKFQLQNQ